MPIRRFFYFLILTLSAFCKAQTLAAQDVNRDSYFATDSLVLALGPMKDSSLKRIVQASTALCRDQVCLVRAIYLWVTDNIEYDCSAAGRPSRVNNSASHVLAARKSSSLGYANLVAEMCRIAGLKCQVASGLVKWNSDHIGDIDDGENLRSWNIVEAANRLFVLDAALGAGFCEGRDFVSELTDAWYLTNRKLFALNHFPDDKRWQLLDSPVKRSVFAAAPVIGPAAAIYGIFPMPGQSGTLRGRQDSALQVSFRVQPREMMERIQRTSVIVEGSLKEIPFSKSADILNVVIPFPKAGKYPISLLVNNSNALTFRAEALPKLNRRDRK